MTATKIGDLIYVQLSCFLKQRTLDDLALNCLTPRKRTFLFYSKSHGNGISFKFFWDSLAGLLLANIEAGVHKVEMQPRE